jgi:two-component system, NarL family, sensor histidine kinase FusK
MGKEPWNNAWLKQIAVAIGFAVVYELAHPFSHAQFALGSALRLIWLLFLPYRYWAALLVGEFVPNLLAILPCMDQFGVLWVAFRAIPPLTVMMPIVWYCRSRMALFPSKRLINIKTLLICTLASSLALTAYSSVGMVISDFKSGTQLLTGTIALCYFMGYYFAMLAVVPWPLILRFELRTGHWRDVLHNALESRLLLEGMTVMLPATVLLALTSHHQGADHPQLVLMATFLPVAWLTLRHGWRAAAFGGTITIICAVLVLPNELDNPNVGVIQIELFLAVTITSLFALGARISAHLMQQQQAVNGQRLARQSYQQGELRLRQTAHSLELVTARLHATNGRLLRQIRLIHPHIENEDYYQQATASLHEAHQLAESLHPTAWRSRGLPAALQETIGRALEDAGIAYRCEITGRGFARMQPAVLSAAYRLACEAIAHVIGRLSCSSVRLILRGGETHHTRWVFIGIEASMDEAKVAHAVHHAMGRRLFATKLGTNGMTPDSLRDQVGIFDGELHYRSNDAHTRITMLLHDTRRVSEKNAAPVRLWVH